MYPAPNKLTQNRRSLFLHLHQRIVDDHMELEHIARETNWSIVISISEIAGGCVKRLIDSQKIKLILFQYYFNWKDTFIRLQDGGLSSPIFEFNESNSWRFSQIVPFYICLDNSITVQIVVYVWEGHKYIDLLNLLWQLFRILNWYLQRVHLLLQKLF